MTIKPYQIKVRGIPVEVFRKDIKNLYLRVYPPAGRVRISAPLHMDDEALRLAVVSRLKWIERQQIRFDRQDQLRGCEMITGEIHYVEGRPCRLDVVEYSGPAMVSLLSDTTLELRVRRKTNRAKRVAILDNWYRQRLRLQIEALVPKWEPKVGVKVAEWRIKKMKTRWGSCNIAARRIWLNLELAKKPAPCLEYVLVHEMTHFSERLHNQRFREQMDKLLPQWRVRRDQLNLIPSLEDEHPPAKDRAGCST